MAEGAGIGALAVRIGADATGLIAGFGQAEKAASKFSRSVNKHAESLAKMGAAAFAAGAAVLAFTKHATNTMDQLGKLSQKIGVSVEGLSALKHAASISDVSLEQLGVGLRFLSKGMAETQANTGEAREAFRALGISVTDASGALKPTEEQFLQLAEKFEGMEDGAGKTALAMKIFGRSGSDLIPMLNMGRAGLEAARKEAERLGIVFSTQAAKDAEEFNDNLTRLTSAADGLAIKLAGPLVKALGDASKAMLEANRQGQGFFATLLEGWRNLATGNDAHKLNVQIVEATDLLIAEQNRLDAMRSGRKGMRPANQEEIDAQVRAVKEARAEVERLVAIKPILAPEETPGAPGKKGAAPRLEDSAAVKAAEAEATFLGNALQAGQDEETRIASETAQLSDDLRARERKELQAHVDERNRILIEAYDREQEEAIAHGAEQIEIDEAIAENKKKVQQAQIAGAQTFLGNMASLMNTHSRKAFEVGKAAAMAQAAVSGGLAVMDAWKAGMSVGGPWAPVVAAAYAAAAAANAINLINNIRKQTFGGSGVTPTAPTQGSSNIAPGDVQGSAPGSGGGGKQTTIVNFQGTMDEQKLIRRFVTMLNENNRDGGRFVLGGA